MMALLSSATHGPIDVYGGINDTSVEWMDDALIKWGRLCRDITPADYVSSSHLLSILSLFPAMMFFLRPINLFCSDTEVSPRKSPHPAMVPSSRTDPTT
jgi:hypothetical protein